MGSFDRLNHLTRPAVENFPRLEHQPPAINTLNVIKSEGDASIRASSQEMQTKVWFKSPPLTAQTVRMIRGIKLFAESHAQGDTSDLIQGNCTWIQLAILDNKEAASPKKGRDGQELVVTSHPNQISSEQYNWLQGETFDKSHDFLKSLEAGNVIAVRLCARFAAWDIYAQNGHLVIDIGDDNNPVPITPILINSNDPMPPRRNVNTWYEEAQTSNTTGLELSLFIRAMKTFQLLPPEDQLSYYRIAGIHGFPSNVSWNMCEEPLPIDPNKDTRQKNGQGGWYCQHNKYVFPTWHRVYMMLFERRVSDLMMKEAETRASETEEWVLAAKRWRMPYWDWAASPRLPDLARDKKIHVIQSWNDQNQPQMEELDNPMYRFQMPGHKPMGDLTYGDYRIGKEEGYPWEQCIGTSRHGIPSQCWVEGYSNAEEVDAALQGYQERFYLTLKDSIFRLLTLYYTTRYVHFASTKHSAQSLRDAPGDPAKHYLNLEQIHNNIHELIGSNADLSSVGHMCSLAVAGFDPVFWLHHCNVDRLLHLWQCSNPGNWFRQKGDGVVDDGPQQDLIPFHPSSDIDDFYNSNMVRYVDALNYTYDYMEEITDAFGDLVPDKSYDYINKLYGPEEKYFKSHKKNLDPVINVIYDRYAFDGRPYSILFFLGKVDHKVSYSKQKSLVGSVFTFSTYLKQGAVACKNCYEQQHDKVLSHAQVPLTRVVPIEQRRSQGTAMEYFRKNLKWVAVLENDEVVDKKQLAGLNLTLLIGVNQLQHGKPLFQFEDYRDQEFDWDSAYVSS